VIGVVRSFTRKGKHISCDDFGYKFYCGILPLYRFLREGYRKVRWMAGKAKRSLFRKVLGKA
jgi:hypothetical protein